VRIAVCDVGLGNLRSVERALLEAGRDVTVQVDVTRDPARIAAADRVVMPGQGGFGDCARGLSSGGGMGDAVREHLRAGRPYLGICLGLQVLFGSSEEAPGVAGLGVVPGRVVRLKGGIDPATGAPLKIPHVGWNTADPRPGHEGLLSPGPAQHFYFVHSFVVVPEDAGIVAATTDYGGPFVSAIAYENVFACQFHPEKSARAGLALLERFMRS
jgi:glutamine amidotransferase